MRATYGIGYISVDVSDKIRDVVDLRNLHYNAIFPDPIIGIVKELVIEDDNQCLLRVLENTPIVIDTMGKDLPVYVSTVSSSSDMNTARHSALSNLYSKKDEECILGYEEETSSVNYNRIFSLFPLVSLIVPEIWSNGVLPLKFWYARSSYVRELPPPVVGDTHQWIHTPGSLIGPHIYVAKSNCMIHPSIGIFSHPPTKEDKYILVDLNYTNQYGLTNQILILSAALLAGSLTGRKVVVSGFYPNYNARETVHISELIDIDRYNEYLGSIGTCLLDIRDLPEKPWRLVDHWNVPCPVSAIQEKIGEYPYVLIPMMMLDFDTFVSIPNEEYLPLYMGIRRNLPFSQYILDRSSSVKAHIGTHLRLEDDMITHMTQYHLGYNEEEHVQKVYTSIHDTCMSEGGSVYICTGLGKYPNKYNHVLSQLKKELDVIDGTSLGRGREFDAAVDMAICLNCEVFIGPGKIVDGVVLPTMTTFSAYIADVMMSRGKKILLI